MTKKYKELLLKDICCRLSYGVKASTKIEGNIKISSVEYDTIFSEDGDAYDVSFITLYLFPLSSMSEEQKYEFYCRFIENNCDFDGFKFYLNNDIMRKLLTSLDDIEGILDWFHKNHIDYRGLIPQGLAINATGLNIY